MAFGIAIAVSDSEGSFAIPFLASIITSLMVFSYLTLKAFMNDPRNSPAYVTWQSFATVLFGLLVPLISALLWISFTIGRIDARLDILIP